MIINNINKIESVMGGYSSANTATRHSKTPAKADQVDLSATARDFKTVLEVVSKVPDIREDKINDIANRINNGEYNISSRDIASKILNI